MEKQYISQACIEDEVEKAKQDYRMDKAEWKLEIQHEGSKIERIRLVIELKRTTDKYAMTIYQEL